MAASGSSRRASREGLVGGPELLDRQTPCIRSYHAQLLMIMRNTWKAALLIFGNAQGSRPRECSWLPGSYTERNRAFTLGRVRTRTLPAGPGDLAAPGRGPRVAGARVPACRASFRDGTA